nr:MAG TPA: Redirecting phage packaging protein C packaging protein, DNA Binding.0A [Caudoviricetes sp.]
MKNTEKRYMTMKEAMEYTGMGELTLLETLRVIDAYPIQPSGSGTRRFIDKTDIDEAFRILKDKERVIRHTRSGRHPF